MIFAHDQASMDELQKIKSMIFEIRGFQVMLDADLAKIYQVETRVMNQAVKRNIDRFPSEFMFQLTQAEYNNLKSQFVTSNLKSQNATSSWGGRRKLLYEISYFASFFKGFIVFNPQS